MSLLDNATRWCPHCSSKVSPQRRVAPGEMLWRCRGCGWEGTAPTGQPATPQAQAKQANTYASQARRRRGPR